MIVDHIDPPSLAPIMGSAHISVAKGDTILHISGQTGVDADGQVVGSTFAEQATQALRNLATALDAAGAKPADVAKLTIYIKDYTPDALEPWWEPPSRCSAISTRSRPAPCSVWRPCGSPTSSSRSTPSRSSDRSLRQESFAGFQRGELTREEMLGGGVHVAEAALERSGAQRVGAREQVGLAYDVGPVLGGEHGRLARQRDLGRVRLARADRGGFGRRERLAHPAAADRARDSNVGRARRKLSFSRSGADAPIRAFVVAIRRSSSSARRTTPSATPA